MGSQGDMADTGSVGGERRRSVRYDEAEGAGPWTINSRLSPWDSYHWTPCADGKLRRTPANSQRMAHGVSDGVPSELGEGEKATWPTPKQVDGGKNLRGYKSAVNEIKRGATSLAVECHMAGEFINQKGLPLHRSVLAALGNSIVWPVALEIIKAIIRADDESMY